MLYVLPSAASHSEQHQPRACIFRTTFIRRDAAVKGLDFGWPEPADAAGEHLETDTT